MVFRKTKSFDVKVKGTYSNKMTHQIGLLLTLKNLKCLSTPLKRRRSNEIQAQKTVRIEALQ